MVSSSGLSANFTPFRDPVEPDLKRLAGASHFGFVIGPGAVASPVDPCRIILVLKDAAATPSDLHELGLAAIAGDIGSLPQG